MGARRDDITSQLRTQLALTMLNPLRPHGTVTQLAQQHQLSRQSLYTLAQQAQALLLCQLAPAPHGPPTAQALLQVDTNRVQRAILQLSMAGLSQRDVVAALAELLDCPLALGSVNNTLARLEQRAAAVNAAWQPASNEGLAADELFANNRPHLLIVGNDSLFIYSFSPQQHRDASTWGCAFLDAPDAPQVATDGGTGLAAGLQQAGRAEQQLDWDHLLRSLWLLDHERERGAYAALERVAEREAYFNAATTPKRLVAHLAAWEVAVSKAEQAIEQYDRLHCLVRAVDEEFAMVELTSGQLREPLASRQRLQQLGEQLQSLPGRRAVVVGTSLCNWAAGLVSYLPRVKQMMAPLAQRWGEQAVRALQRLWQVEANQRRGHLGVVEQQRLNGLWQQSVEQAASSLGDGLFDCWEQVSGVLGKIWRGSMAAECINSLYRPLVRARKHSDAGISALFSFMHNTHEFTRGKRAGHSPAELVGLALPNDPLTLLGLEPKVSI